jgi:hypothetical protein
MNRTLPLIALLLGALTSTLNAQTLLDVSLAWDPNPETDIAGYRLYYGTEPRVYSAPVDVIGQVTTGVVPGLLPGVTYFFAATAYNTAGLESDYSDEISYTTPAIPGRPTGLRAQGVIRSTAPPTP